MFRRILLISLLFLSGCGLTPSDKLIAFRGVEMRRDPNWNETKPIYEKYIPVFLFELCPAPPQPPPVWDDPEQEGRVRWEQRQREWIMGRSPMDEP